MRDYKEMPYAIPENYIEMAKIRAKAAIAAQACEPRRHPLYYHIAVAVALLCLGIAAWGIMRQDDCISYDDFKAELQDMPTEVLYEISCDIIEYNDEYSQL